MELAGYNTSCSKYIHQKNLTFKTNIMKSIQLPSVLLILFIGLKLANIIQWSWLWVLSPFWIYFVIVGFVVFMVWDSISNIERQIKKQIKRLICKIRGHYNNWEMSEVRKTVTMKRANAYFRGDRFICIRCQKHFKPKFFYTLFK